MSTLTEAPRIRVPADAEARSAIHHQIVIVGGGTAGLTVAARLTKGWFNDLDVAVIEPSGDHYYQPMWTLIGGGVFPKEKSRRREADVMPKRAHWLQDAVAKFSPDRNELQTRDGKTITYDWLVVAAGLQLYWDKIPGLREALGKNGVCSNYSYDTVETTWNAIRNFRGGTALFTQPSGAVKCGGAPQKIMYLAEDWFRRSGVRDKSRVIFATATPNLFAVERYRKTLEDIVRRRDIECLFQHELIEIRAASQEAVFKRLDGGDPVSVHYDLLHVTPPMEPPAFLASSPLADEAGWVKVDPQTLRHLTFPNVFAVGDCSSLPTSKTGAAVRKQAPVLVQNLRSAMKGEPLTAVYNGYTSCPLVTGYGKLVLAEFGYDKQPMETFPIDQSKERLSMYLLKKYGLPRLYWHGMLKGRA